ncbi:conserved uncharacterized protein, DUF3568 [Desulfosarcina variabilis str. Montpellier]|uniref:DUF3568 family protein n=1 Tax=Desulfosarcina variabilis TaxID=2300 RepID=UPI003AFB6C83
MARSVLLVGLLLVLSIITGCAALVIGAGAGAGVYTYVKGELISAYAADVNQTYDATIQSLNYLKIAVDEKKQENDATLIRAHQNDGSPVTVRMRATDNNMTEVAVRCGRIGFWDRKTAELIHVTIRNTI